MLIKIKNHTTRRLVCYYLQNLSALVNANANKRMCSTFIDTRYRAVLECKPQQYMIGLPRITTFPLGPTIA